MGKRGTGPSDGVDVRVRLRAGGRIALYGAAAGAFALVAMQVEVVVAKNVAIVRELRDTQDDVASLKDRRREQERTLRRLRDARGAVPEIHDKLRLVGPREQIFFVRGLPRPTPQPGDWRPQS